jgi:hypothetical protein
MSMVLPVDLDLRPLHRVIGDLIAAPLFATGLPMRGPAAWLDWRMCGALARTLASGRHDAAEGSALLAPTRGRLRASWLLLLGVGDPASFGEPSLRAFAEDALARAAALRLGTVALALPPDRLSRLPLERAIHGVVAGAAAALAAHPSPLRLRVVVAPAEQSRAESALASTPRSYPGGVNVRVDRALGEDAPAADSASGALQTDARAGLRPAATPL